MADRLSVTVLDNGPLKISEPESLSYCGERVEVEGDVYICRCGKSQNAPFCDGSHNQDGIAANPAREAKDVHVWEGRTIRTRFNPNACMHVFYCKPLKALREAELAGDDAAAAEIARVVGGCPSGALSWEAKTPDCEATDVVAEPVIEAERGVAVAIQEGGEVRIQCAFEINAELPAGLSGDRATLCRCGQSKNKPFCDGRHKKLEDFR